MSGGPPEVGVPGVEVRGDDVREDDVREVDVLVVGGGGAGLTASMLLSRLGIDSLLVSARPDTSTVPKAHVLNQRTMEILRELGLAEQVYAAGTPAANMSHTGWYAGLRGEHDDYGREIARIECWGAGATDPAWVAASPCRTTNLPQIRLEPLLRRRAEELAPGRVRFGREVTALDPDEDGVTATVRDVVTDEVTRVRARYVLGCDGGRFVGPDRGVTMEGVSNLFRSVSVHATTDLTRWLRDDEVLIRWIWLPHIGTSCAIVPMGPQRWGTDSEEWVFHLSFPMDVPVPDDEAVVAELRRALGLDRHPMQVHRINRWLVEGVVADRFADGRVLLLGDAVRRLPPTGGLGLNSAIQDAHNLVWKLAAVLQGQAGPGLLDSYEAERKPVTVQFVQHAVANIVTHLRGMEAAGFGPGSDPDRNWATLRRMWGDDPADEDLRRRMRRAFADQSGEFDALGIEYGFELDPADPATALVDDGSPADPPPDPRIHRPGTRPGALLPHAWVDPDGDVTARLPVMDLVRPGRFLLIAGEDGQAWTEAAAKVAGELGVGLDAVRIGHLDGDLLAPGTAWLDRRGTGPGGAVLVRPDRVVAWRATGPADDPEAEMTAALDAVLRRDR